MAPSWSPLKGPASICSSASAELLKGYSPRVPCAASAGSYSARLVVRADDERRADLYAGHTLERVRNTRDLVAGGNVFFTATGVTDGALVEGVPFEPHRVITQSWSMRFRTVRLVQTRHDPNSLFLAGR
jgi:fructose-1,6-bisphosphatase/sedoheptulose 1,7-bisphosphatase-like protein